MPKPTKKPTARPRVFKDVPGCALLVRWLNVKWGRAAELARVCQVHRNSVNHWKFGITRPERDLRDLVRHVTGIDPADWLTPEEREEQRRRELLTG